tara:strand:- start:52 stop:414 length:363 start_codon:yes stop_codon:yes gene_type:complete
MKNLFLIFLTICAVNFGLAQDPIYQNGNDSFEKEAYKLAKEYNKELVLSGKQFNLFQKKIEEFMIRREKIEADFSGKEKLDKLYKLQTQETGEMRNILTQPQFRLYKEIKTKHQPLDTVE